ncbi:NADPH-dependent F420 reductase [Niabella soli]|uniref:DNA-binding protein n=1 Tax=Niabella soli DSM 19437 TaxID=929713 RepID=W0F159_9BACT|nr:NAD(P)-binding domain-containing protein [Niabella soli]AHF16790.1 DNA-binding protein [Niabella soli DSM 19437]
MKIGIIGSGDVGQTLAKAFANEGHETMLGTRNTSKQAIVKFKNENPEITVGTFAETAVFAELVVLAVSGAVAEEAIATAGKNNFSNKIVIDVTNPISSDAPVNGVLHFFTSLEESLMEKIQAIIPYASVVKAFSSVGNARMYKPDFKEGKPTMFICGNNDAAKKTVTTILTAFGWETEDMGKVEAARAIEPLCMLWCIPGFLHNQWSHAFKLLKT